MKKNIKAEAGRTRRDCTTKTACMLECYYFDNFLDETIEEYAQDYAWMNTPERDLEEILERIARGDAPKAELEIEIAGLGPNDKIADFLLAYKEAESERIALDIIRNDRERIARYILLETMRRDNEKTIDEADLELLTEYASDRERTIGDIMDAAVEHDDGRAFERKLAETATKGGKQ